MKLPYEQKIGDCTIRIVAKSSTFQGAAIRHGKVGEKFDDDDVNRLLARLRNEAGKLHPNYVGMDGAISRFRHFFPDGFDDKAFDVDERQCKRKSSEALNALVPIQVALRATADDAVAVRKAYNTNLLSRFELARMHQILGSSEGIEFVKGAAVFTQGNHMAGLTQMVSAISPHGRCSWPMLTYLPNLWDPENHMFLKPVATLDFAQRVGHKFQFDYSSEIDALVYNSLLDLVMFTEASIKPLGARDRLDVQSFIWVVGNYTDKELPRLEQIRAER